MATKQTKKRNRLLTAALLALLAAGSLCVWGASALGFEVSSPILDAFIEGFTEARAAAGENGGDAEANGGASGDVAISAPMEDGAGDDDDPGSGDDAEAGTPGDGDGTTADGEDGTSADASASGGFCFFNLICFRAAGDANASSDAVDPADGASVGVNAQGDEKGFSAGASARGADSVTETDCRRMDVNADGVLDADDDIEGQSNLDVAVICDELGFTVDLDAILRSDN